MPSKALIEAANAYYRRGALEAFGIRGSESLRVDLPAVLRRVRTLRDHFIAGPESIRDELGERAVSGRARLEGPGRLSVNGGSVEARAFILAPGSRPVLPEPWKAFGDRLLTTDTIFEQEDLPRRMAGEAAGVLRIHAERDSGVLVGAELCAPAAEHLAHLLALAVERGLTVSDMLAMPFPPGARRRPARSAAVTCAGAPGCWRLRPLRL
jgi:pyruvate/2-oxoglutarate dehydrogenase complex dihydrolipoamide dehydrogenase (E3) component